MTLPRLQLFEFEDFPWFPAIIRDLATDYLHFMETRFALHRAVVPVLRTALETTATTTVVDLCSGGGGPVLALYQAFAADGTTLRFILTDKYPNLPAFRRLTAAHEKISAVTTPVDAAAVPRELAGFRTVFNAFHHFSPLVARAVLQSAVAARQPIGIFEIPERAMITMLPLLFTPLFVALATPFIRPFRWRRLLWTYLLPLVPLTCWWDGLVSQWRAYSVAELERLAEGLGDTRYEWRAGRVALPGSPGHLTFLIGLPRAG
jgi:hypothetical protein